MSLNAKKDLVEIAKLICRDLRKRSTKAEEILWEQLRNRKLDNKKYYRQYPIFYDIHGGESFFIADFFCFETKIVIELDGEIHNYRLKEDASRTEILNLLGLTIIRFKNEDVEKQLEMVLEKIKSSN
jgi:very-short-patch-repair endonuclease